MCSVCTVSAARRNAFDRCIRCRRHRQTAGALDGNPNQILIQLYGIGVTLAWSGVVTLVLLKVINLLVPLRVRDEDERAGLDLALRRGPCNSASFLN
jgi:ammonia channel protein AmtB